jgi:hypothetical protein
MRPVLSELALGIATGEERAGALSHVARCADCRRELEGLTQVADELLLLVPATEPPLGFESRVLERIAGRRSRRPRRRPLLRSLAAVAATAFAAWLVTSLSFHDDRKLASQYRDALAAANGKYFDAQKLRDERGHSVGQVFFYEGSPSWVLVIVPGSQPAGRYEMSLMTESGRRIALRGLRVSQGRGSIGQAIPVRIGQVKSLLVRDQRQGRILHADLAEP